MKQRVIEDNRMHVQHNQLYFKPHRKFDEGLMVSEDVEGKYIQKVGVHETRLQNEVWLDIWYAGSEVTQHIHTNACETFYIIDGKARLITPGGVQTILNEGDIFHCPAGMAHEFHTEGDHMAWYNLFSNLHYWNIIQTEIDMSRHNPAKMRDVAYYRDFISSMNSLKLGPYPPVFRDGEPSQVRRKGDCLLSYEALGIKFNLKVAPWDTNDANEIWEIALTDGMSITALEPFNSWQTYIICEGEVECKVGDDEFTAVKNDFIQIYPHKPFELKCKGDVTALSWGSGYKLLKALEEIAYIKNEMPGQFEETASHHAFMQKYGIPVFDIK